MFAYSIFVFDLSLSSSLHTHCPAVMALSPGEVSLSG